mgnify:FL=1
MLLLGGMIWSICQHLLPSLIDPRSYAAASIAIPLAASLVLTFRILGFRFIRLTGSVSDADHVISFLKIHLEETRSRVQQMVDGRFDPVGRIIGLPIL